MTTGTQALSVTKSVTVRAGRERAFTVFTEKFFTWWPKSHHIGDAELTHRHIERHDDAEQVRAGVDSPGGWGGILAGYAEAVA